MKIYIVTQGVYSDYHICGVFTKRELAELFTKKFNDSVDSFDIEEYEADMYEEQLRSDYNPYFLRMTKEGKAYGIRLADSTHGFTGDEYTTSFDAVEGDMYTHCLAKDEKHAIKIANERRVQLIANNQWGKK